ncbi:MAG: hypothetical protein WAW85_16465 [Gordonia sp. (in: high G+C Gram-positive bacteria)]
MRPIYATWRKFAAGVAGLTNTGETKSVVVVDALPGSRRRSLVSA